MLAKYEAGADAGFDQELRQQYQKILNIGGDCRFFGLRQLCSRLRVTTVTQGGASKPTPRQLDVLESLLRWNQAMRGRVATAIRRAEEDRKVIPLWQELESAIHSDLVPV